jgi:hypothetical protein
MRQRPAGSRWHPKASNADATHEELEHAKDLAEAMNLHTP